MAQNVIDAAGTLANVTSYLTGGSGGFALTTMELQGTLSAVGVYDSVALSPDITFSRGVLLTSGTGTPGRTNTSSGYSVSTGAAGNNDLTAFASAAFSGAGTTFDATVLTLTFTITDPSIKTLSFSVAFGSDEYPEYSDSSFVDIGAIWTGTGANAKNYALVNGDTNTPLAVIDENVSLGNFINNQAGGLAIEYDGIINRQTILVPVTLGENIIKVGVADTGDQVLDSGLFLFDITGSGSTIGGNFQTINVSAGGTFDAGANNTIFQGNAQEFNGTTLTNFDDLDQIFINGSFFSDIDALLGVGSLELKFDTDNDGIIDTEITLDDPVINATVNIAATPDGTAITLTALAAATDGNDTINGADGLDYIGGGKGADTLNGLGGSDALSGGEGTDKLFGGSGTDWLDGGKGADQLTGGEGADIFFFSAAEATGKDRIFDFDADDILVSDARIRDNNNDDVISFGRNKMLDLAGGDLVTITSDSGGLVQQLEYDGSYTDAGGKIYYVYSSVGSSAGLSTLTQVGNPDEVLI